MMGRRKNLNDKFGFVDSMKIKDFIDYEQPNEYIVESDRYNSKYSTPVLTAGQSFILGYTNESKGIYKKGPCIIFDDFTTSVHYVDFPFKVKSSAMKILTTKSNTDLKYCYYLLLSLSKMPPNHKRQWISTTSEKNHVLPSMDRQISIVKQLDLISDTIVNYTNQIENLDNLVKARFIEMFGDAVDNPMEWKKRKLQEIVTDDCTISYGIVQTGNDQEDGVPVFRPVDIVNKIPKLTELKKTTEEISNKYKRTILKGRELLITVRANIADTCIIDEEFKGCNVGRGIVPIRIQEDIMVLEFLKYLLDSKHLNDDIKSKAKGITLIQLNMEDLREVELICPPLEKQIDFVEFAKQVDKSREEVKKSLEKTQQLYDSLMQEYFG